MRYSVTAVVLALAICSLLSHAWAESERVFSAQGCRYTLPGPSWEWVDEAEVPHGVFMARDDTGLVMTLIVQPALEGATIGSEFIAGLERGARKNDLIVKRGSRKIRFKGVPCYQMELLMKSERKTAVNRIFIDRGTIYGLQLIGTEDHVEDHPAFEAAMNGFDFLQSTGSAHAPQTSTEDENESSLEKMGEQFAKLLTIVFLVGLVIWGVQKFRNK